MSISPCTVVVPFAASVTTVAERVHVGFCEREVASHDVCTVPVYPFSETNWTLKFALPPALAAGGEVTIPNPKATMGRVSEAVCAFPPATLPVIDKFRFAGLAPVVSI